MGAGMRSTIGRRAIVPLWIIEADISSNAVRLFALLDAEYTDREGVGVPARATLARTMRVSEDTVDRAKGELVKIGALRQRRRGKPGGGPATNEYVLEHAGPSGGAAPVRLSVVPKSATVRSDPSRKVADQSLGATDPVGTTSAEVGAPAPATVDKSGKDASRVVADIANAITRKGLPTMERIVRNAVATQVRDLIRGGWSAEEVSATAIELAGEWDSLRRYSKLMHIGSRQRAKSEQARLDEHQRRKLEERHEREAKVTPATRQQAADIAMSWSLRAALP